MEIDESAHARFMKPLTIALMIALQVVRASFGFHLRECMGCPPPPPLVHKFEKEHNSTFCILKNNIKLTPTPESSAEVTLQDFIHRHKS